MDDTYYPRGTRERAAKIPDEFFADHAEVIYCRAALAEAEEAHAKHVPAYGAAVATFKTLEARIAALEARVGEVQGTLKTVAAQCLQEGDLEFTAAVAAYADLQRLKWQHQAAVDAMPAAQEGLNSPRRTIEGTSLRIDSAMAKLQELLKRLKLEHAHRSY